MTYDLFFLRDIPALGVSMSFQEWEALPDPALPMNPDIQAFLGTASRWRSGKIGRIGYGGIVQVFAADGRAELRFPLNRRTLRRSMLSLSFLMPTPSNWSELKRSGECAIWLDVGNTIRWQSVSGGVSQGFTDRLEKISTRDLTLIRENMDRAWEMIAPRFLLPLREFGIGVRDGRFEIGFADGSGCDVSMYPDSPDNFGCHNLDSVLQQATCLAGLFSLYERVKESD